MHKTNNTPQLDTSLLWMIPEQLSSLLRPFHSAPAQTTNTLLNVESLQLIILLHAVTSAHMCLNTTSDDDPYASLALSRTSTPSLLTHPRVAATQSTLSQLPILSLHSPRYNVPEPLVKPTSSTCSWKIAVFLLHHPNVHHPENFDNYCIVSGHSATHGLFPTH